MSKSELNILRFLQGDATPEEMNKLQQWSAKKTENQERLAAAQAVFQNTSSLSEHKRVDVDAEWSSFMSKVRLQVSDNDILHYVDGTADYTLRQKVESWASNTPDNQKSLDTSMTIHKVMKGIDTHKQAHATTEYLYHVKKRNNTSTVAAPSKAPADIVEMPKASSSKSAAILPMWSRYAAAASMALLMAAFVYMYNPAPSTITYATAGPHTLSDGSIVTLAEESSITAFANIDKVETREVQLTGNAKFDIARIENKPFNLSSENDLGISVLGTVFDISSSPDYLALISTERGSIAAFDVKKPEEKHVILEGESMGFSADGFVKIIEEVDLRKLYSVQKVLDHLMENSNWKVSAGFANNFRLNSKVLVDLDLPYQEIIQALSDAGQLEYRTPREGYYEITSFSGE